MSIIDEGTRTQIIIAAINAAGPVGEDPKEWNSRVTGLAVSITTMVAPTSSISRQIDAIGDAKVYTAVITSLVKEDSSTRGLVTMAVPVSQWAKDGTEKIRTDRTDTEEGRAMVRRIKPLIGHKVAIWKQLETAAGSSTKVGVIRHIEDLGLSE